MGNYIAGTHLAQKNYVEMATSGGVMDESTAILLINKWFGFEASRIEIMDEVKTFAIEGGRIIPTSTIKRGPVYEATDMNYVRFNCCENQYEMINGELYFYED